MGAVGYYLDREVRFDTKACYLGRPSNEIVHKIARLAILDTNALNELSAKQKVEFDNHPKVIRLSQKTRTSPKSSEKWTFRPTSIAEGTDKGDCLYEKRKAKAGLSRFKT